jgi:hypothetical protein
LAWRRWRRYDGDWDKIEQSVPLQLLSAEFAGSEIGTLFRPFWPRNLIELFLSPYASHSQTALGPGETKLPASTGDGRISKFGTTAALQQFIPLNASSILARVMPPHALPLSVPLRYSQNRAIFSHRIARIKSRCTVHIRSKSHHQFHSSPNRSPIFQFAPSQISLIRRYWDTRSVSIDVHRSSRSEPGPPFTFYTLLSSSLAVLARRLLASNPICECPPQRHLFFYDISSMGICSMRNVRNV